MLDHSLFTLLDGQRLQVNSERLLVVSLREVVAVVNDAVSSEYVNVSSDTEISGRVELLFGHVHTWVASLDWLLGKFLFFQ
jgi:hypothetical protein